MAILLALDLVADPAPLVQAALDEARLGCQRVIAVHVTPGNPPLEALRRLYEATEPLRAAGLEIRLRAVGGDPVARLLAEARRAQVKSIVLGCPPRGGHVFPAIQAATQVRLIKVPLSGLPLGVSTRVAVR